MADVIKVLGQIYSTGSAQDLYTVPNLFSTTCSTLVVCNQTSASIAFRVSVRPAAAVQATKHYLFYDTPLGANSTLTATIGITLAQTDVVTVYAPAGISFSLFGVETT